MEWGAPVDVDLEEVLIRHHKALLVPEGQELGSTWRLRQDSQVDVARGVAAVALQWHGLSHGTFGRATAAGVPWSTSGEHECMREMNAWFHCAADSHDSAGNHECCLYHRQTATQQPARAVLIRPPLSCVFYRCLRP